MADYNPVCLLLATKRANLYLIQNKIMSPVQRPNPFKPFFFLLTLAMLAGCSSFASRTEQMAGNISRAMLNQDDPDIVRTGAPAYLLLLDGMIEGNPDDRALLIAGARLYGAYAMGLVKDTTRRMRLSTKARSYARRALCGMQPAVCAHETRPFRAFAPYVDEIGQEDLKALYTYGTSWASWIQTHSGNWEALADLPKVEHILQRIITLEPKHDRGRAQLYLGVMHTQLPPAMGGKPEVGRAYFERAIQYSNSRDLMAKVEFARRYARLVFDQPLHDRLLKEVLEAEPVEPELTLSNILAQQQARELLADDYF